MNSSDEERADGPTVQSSRMWRKGMPDKSQITSPKWRRTARSQGGLDAARKCRGLLFSHRIGNGGHASVALYLLKSIRSMHWLASCSDSSTGSAVRHLAAASPARPPRHRRLFPIRLRPPTPV
eukprot:10686007-Prorocentrum_lima.AAC.1